MLRLALVPSYALFALGLMVVSPCATRLAKTPRDLEMRIADLDWPLLRRARYMAAIHVVRVLAGTLFRATLIWTAYLRLCGARVGRRVHVGSERGFDVRDVTHGAREPLRHGVDSTALDGDVCPSAPGTANRRHDDCTP